MTSAIDNNEVGVSSSSSLSSQGSTNGVLDEKNLTSQMCIILKATHWMMNMQLEIFRQNKHIDSKATATTDEVVKVINQAVIKDKRVKTMQGTLVDMSYISVLLMNHVINARISKKPWFFLNMPDLRKLIRDKYESFLFCLLKLSWFVLACAFLFDILVYDLSILQNCCRGVWTH